MSSTLDRLRRLQSLRPQRSRPEPTYTPIEDDLPVPSVRVPRIGSLEELAPGVEIATAAGGCYVVAESYPLSEPRGEHALGELLGYAPSILAPFHPDFGLDTLDGFTNAAFIDTETTGLGAGASVYAFMIGVGTFERVTPDVPLQFVVRQFFMRHPGEEGAVLTALADLLADRQLAVTFNGRTFDLPLLRARYLQNRRTFGGRPGVAVLQEGAPHLDLLHPARRLWRRRLQSCRLINLEQMILGLQNRRTFGGRPGVAVLQEGAPHLDLLHPARRLWRRRLQSCRLINLEQMILGLQRNEDDVSGSLIPYLYLDYLRTGNAGEMSRVFYHNREDIVSMVSLAHRLIQAYVEPEQAEVALGVQAEDWLALGVAYERRGEAERAELAYRRALDAIHNDRQRADAFGHLADLLKRQARWEAAAEVWELWLTSVPGVDPTPYVELAKYSEWQLRDLARAEMWTAWALHNLTSAPVYQRLPGQVADLEHRLARIRRKQGQ